MADFLHDHGVRVFILGFILLFLIIALLPGGMLSKYDYEYYVFACPKDRSDTKCYKLVADIQEEECETDYDYRSTSSYCTDPSVNTIYFPNGGHIDFDYCDYDSKNEKWSCIEGNTGKSDSWEVTFAEKVKKLQSE